MSNTRNEEEWYVYHPGTNDYLEEVKFTKSGLTDDVRWTKEPKEARRYTRKMAVSMARNYGPTYDGDPVEIRKISWSSVGPRWLAKITVRKNVSPGDVTRAKNKAKRKLRAKLKRRANARIKLERLQAQNDKLRRTAIACLKREEDRKASYVIRSHPGYGS